MKKPQIKKRIGKIIAELEDLQYDIEETRDSIECYEGKDDLTEQQQERYDKLDELVDDLSDVIDTLINGYYSE